MSLTVNEARGLLVECAAYMAKAHELARRVIIETPRTPPYENLRRAARYAQSGIIPDLTEQEALEPDFWSSLRGLGKGSPSGK